MLATYLYYDVLCEIIPKYPSKISLNTASTKMVVVAKDWAIFCCLGGPLARIRDGSVVLFCFVIPVRRVKILMHGEPIINL